MSEPPSTSPADTGNPPGPERSAPRRRTKRVDKLIGTHLAGKYKILKKIGEGGMGSVYIANQEPIDRKVAVKVLLAKLAEDEISVKRFEQEARAISKMQHPNTVTIYDFGQVDAEDGSERLYIVMEYLKGATLTQVLRKEGALPGPRASRIMRQVCASLADAHGAGIIHRDLKPDNIYLSELGGEKDWVKVLDFGVAKLADSEAAGTLTQTGMIFGTPKYMSPEQAEGKPIDYRADIYALGVVLYELLTGKPPFISDTPVGLLLKHISEPPRPLSEVAADRDIDPRLEAIVLRSLEKHPDRRQQQVTELAAELEQYERAVTGPQAIPTDIGRLSGAVQETPTGRSGLPTEVVPGTLPGQPISPSGPVPPDQVPPDLSAGVGGAVSGTEGFVDSGSVAAAGSTGRATAQGAPATAPGLTAPIGAASLETMGSGLSGEFSGSLPRPSRSRAGWVAAALGVAVVGIGLGVVVFRQGRGPTVERLEGTIDGRPAAVAEPVAPRSPPSAEPDGVDSAEAASTETPRTSPAGQPTPDVATPTPPSRVVRAREPAPAKPSKPAAAPAKTVAIRLESTPPKALVTLAGKQVGYTPVEISVPRGDELLTFVFEKKGYSRVERIATSARDTELAVDLPRRRLPRPAAAEVEAPPKIKTCADGSKPPCTKPVDLNLKVGDLK